MLNEKQLEERKHYIGGSDVGSILGYSKWRTALDVYFEKVEGKRQEFNNNFIDWGNTLEPVIRKKFSEITGFKTSEIVDTKYHKDYPFIAANIDGMIKISETKNAILEIKTVSQFARAQWGKPKCDLELPPENTFLPTNGFKNDDGYIPMNYLCQVILYAAVYEVEKVYIAVYFGNDLALQIYQYDRDLKLEGIVLDQLVYFWKEHIEKEIPPAPMTKAELLDAYPRTNENSFIVIENDLEDDYYKLKKLKQQEKEAKKEIEQLSNKIMKFMGDKEILLDSDSTKLITWRDTCTKRFNTTRFKEENKKLYDKYVKETFSRRFQVY